MSDRAGKMVELARSLAKRQNNEVTLGISGASHVENASTNIQKYRDANEPENFIRERPCDGRFQNHNSNFVPCVQNETMSSIHRIEFNLAAIESLQNPKEISHEAHEDVLPHSGEFDSDNSIRDPDFNLSRSTTSMDCSSNDEETSHQPDNLNGFAKNKSKSKKKLRCDLRNRGKSYTTLSGRIVKARTCNPRFDFCRNKCYEKFTTEQIESLFKHYWSLGSYDQRILYIGSLVAVGDKKCDTLCNTVERKRNRENSMQYSLQINSKTIKVCKKHFRQCFDESDSFIKSVVRKKLSCPSMQFSDHRGKHTPTSKIDTSKENEIKEHILSFPAYESHYNRRDTSQKYLPASLNLSSMHRLYKEKVSNPVSLSKYSEIFKTLGLKFKEPKVDTCSTCDTYVAKIKIALTEDEKASLIEQKENHIAKAELAYESKRQDKKCSVESNTIKSFAFDLQQCLPTPFLRNSISFYKRQLWTFNLTVHDLATNAAKCFMWHEALARRGGNEISSCLFKLLKMLPAETKTVTFYSDSCAGQNKNSFVSAMFLSFISNASILDHIDHKFLEPGHTHMECDCDHALIERKKKKTNVEIETPRDWYQFVNTIGPKLQTIEMQPNDFYNFSDLSKSKLSWKRFNEDGEKFVWHDIRWLRYTKMSNKIQYKTSLDNEEPFKILKVGKRGCSVKGFGEIQNIKDLPCISKEKKKDLMDLKQFIKPEFHSFYDSIPTSMEQLNTHPDLTECDSDEDF